MLRNVPLALAALGMAVQATPSAAAEFRIHVEVGHHRHYRDARPSPWDVGYERGSEAGLRQGRRDARRHNGSDRWRHGRSGERGYRHWRRNPYEDGYRVGYEEAYRRAYRDYRYDGRWRNHRRAVRRDARGHRHDGRADLCYSRH